MIINHPNPRFLIVGLFSSLGDKEKILAEFEETEQLIRTYGGTVWGISVQNIARKDNATYVGTGKAQEIAETIGKEKIDIVLLNASVRPGQLFTLKKIFERVSPQIIVWDRIDLILKIFERHAETAEAKLQIKLAHMRHMGPRIYGTGMELSQQAGGIGNKGSGETNTELMERHWRVEMRKVHKELDKIESGKYQKIERRKREGYLTVALAGYTNAGKTSLFNRLCSKKNLIENKPFTTLQSTAGRIYLPDLKKEVVVTDTIGFIQNLPMQLIGAFKSTLTETVNADLILHVIDGCDRYYEDKIKVVEKILTEIGIKSANRIYVFNKSDLKPAPDRDAVNYNYQQFHPVFVSVKTGEGIETLISEMQKLLG